MKDHTVTINSLSKTYAMTGWRIGYAVACEPVAAATTKIVSAQSSCTSTVSQYAALEALSGPQDSVVRMIGAFSKRRDVMVKGLNEISGFECAEPAGAFYAFPNIKKTDVSSNKLAMKIIDGAHVAVVPGSSFGNQGEGYLRLAYANSEENIEEALRRIRKFLGS